MKNSYPAFSKLLIILVMLLSGFPLFLAARQNQEQAALKSLATKLFEEFKESTSNINVHLGNIIFSSHSQTHVVNGSADLNFNIDEIGKYVKGESQLFQKLFIQFALAHEIAHKIQFNGYPKSVIESTRGEGAVFLECNADILANFLVTGVINTIELPILLKKPGFDLSAYNLKVQSVAFNVYKKIFRMDQDALIHTHPSQLQRLMAAKAGTLLGNCYNIEFVIPPASGPDLKAYQTNKELLKIIAKAIDFNSSLIANNNNPLLWAHSEAIRITNENNSLARNLVRYGVSVQRERIPGTRDRFYNYSFHIFNENSVAVRFSGRVYTETKFESDPENLVKSVPIDAVSFERIIPPNGNIEIKGSVQYVLQDGISSALILPGDKKSLYFVFDSKRPEIDLSDQSNTDNDFTVWSPGMEEKIYDHIYETLLLKTSFSSHKKGIGISRAENYEDLTTRMVIFEPDFKAGQHDDQIFIYFPRTKNMIYQFLATETTDLETARYRFKLIIDKIRSKMSQEFSFNSLEDTENSKKIEFLDRNNKKILLLDLTKDPITQNYAVEVNIYGK